MSGGRIMMFQDRSSAGRVWAVEKIGTEVVPPTRITAGYAGPLRAQSVATAYGEFMPGPSGTAKNAISFRMSFSTKGGKL